MSCLKLRRSSKRPGEIDTDSSVTPDPNIGSKLVAGLNGDNFQEYLEKIDIALVMFYLSEDRESAWLMKHFKKAAEVTSRPGHAFAAVDCTKNGNFCIDMGEISMPCHRIYSKGVDMGFKSEPRKFLYKDMKEWMERFPVDV